MRTYKILLLFTVCALSYNIVIAQRSGNNWYFGKMAAISFNTDPPEIIKNSALSAIEGCTSLSDNNGKTLLYSNGLTIFNRKNEVMLNGAGISGDPSSTSGAILVAVPDNDHLFYMFSVSAANELVQNFSYSIIDMNGDNGYGEVIQKNVLIAEKVFEKLTATRHCNKKDMWIVVKKWDSNEYVSYLFSSTGISAPVVSPTDLMVDGVDDQNKMIGGMKLSPNGQKLAAAFSGDLNRIQLLDFNNQTGKLTNSKIIKANNGAPSFSYRGLYGLEFSPNSKYLYISANNSKEEATTVYQFDATLNTANLIEASANTIFNTANFIAGALQLAPNRKIYLTMFRDSMLSEIENPNLQGASSNFKYHTVKVAGEGVKSSLESGLPTFAGSDLIEEFANYNFSIIKANCTSKSVDFKINYTADITSVSWDFGDGKQSTALAPNHVYANAGSYKITLTIKNNGCGGNMTFTLSQNIVITNPANILPVSQAICNDEELIIRPPIKADSYLWSTGSNADSIIITTPGQYWLQIERDGCIDKMTIDVTKKPEKQIQLLTNGKTTVCGNDPVEVRTSLTGFNYNWSTGATTPTISVTEPGRYWINFEDPDFCVISDTLNITLGNCDIFFPTAFTPNGDGINDYFGQLNSTFGDHYELTIFDRWGYPIFKGYDQLHKWDGTYKGKRQPMGNYAWTLKFRNKMGMYQIEKGTVLLIR